MKLSSLHVQFKSDMLLKVPPQTNVLLENMSLAIPDIYRLILELL